MTALQKVTSPGERLFALDALHWYEQYTFEPHRLGSADRDAWALAVLPHGNYTILFAPDFRFGVFGNPLEKTFCVFGQELLDSLPNGVPADFGRVLRKDGVPEPIHIRSARTSPGTFREEQE